jgi:membrane protease YdiL (CAAX protease family)
VRPAAEPGAEEHRPSLALGFLAIVPLIVAHEWGAGALQRGIVNLAAVLLALPLAPLGARALEATWVVYGLLAGVSLVVLFRAEFALLPRLLRVLGEGALGALVLGPLLVLLCWLLGLTGAGSALRSGAPAHTPPLAWIGVLCGGAAFEEIVFRLGVLSIAYLAVRRGLLALGAAPRAASLAAEVLALLFSAVVFALSHLQFVVARLAGSGGEPFGTAVFTWRLLAGILLGILFRWRGMGVAAWAHALFNLALYIGAGPDVFL